MARSKNRFDDADHDHESLEVQEERTEKDEHYWAKLADTNRRNGNHENALRFYSRAWRLRSRCSTPGSGKSKCWCCSGSTRRPACGAGKRWSYSPAHGDLLAGRAQAESRLGNHRDAISLSDGALNSEVRLPTSGRCEAN